MKTKQLMNLALISGLLLTAGCWDDQNTGTTEQNEPVELKISPRVTLTRGVVDGTAFPDQTPIAVYAEGSDYTGSNNYAVYKNGSGGSNGTWTSTADGKIYLTNAPATIYACYPVPNPVVTDFESPVTLLDTGTITATDNASDGTPTAAASGEVDCMYATPVSSVTNKANNNVTLAMNHALSMVTFRVYKADDYEGAGNLTQIVMKDVNGAGTTLSKGNTPKMNIKTGAITEGTATDATYTRTIQSSYTLGTAATTAKRFSILVLPITAAIGNNNIQAVFFIDGAEYFVNLTQPDNNDGKWLAGKNHLYTVKLSGTELSITSVTITDWVDVVISGELDIK